MSSVYLHITVSLQIKSLYDIYKDISIEETRNPLFFPRIKRGVIDSKPGVSVFITYHKS